MWLYTPYGGAKKLKVLKKKLPRIAAIVFIAAVFLAGGATLTRAAYPYQDANLPQMPNRATSLVKMKSSMPTQAATTTTAMMTTTVKP